LCQATTVANQKTNRANNLFKALSRVDHFLFGSVFIKKNNQTEIFFKKNTETKPKPVQTDWFRFGFLGQKSVQTGLARFFPVWLEFFPVWVQFGSVFLVSGL
jgi:hypothetical protein